MVEEIYGTYIKNLDEKGRIYMPSQFEVKKDDVLFMVTRENYLRIVRSFENLDEEDYATIRKATIDTYSRITIFNEIRNLLFKKQAIILGKKTHLDIVPVEKIDDYCENTNINIVAEKNKVFTYKKEA